MPHSVPQGVRQRVSDIWEADLGLTLMLVFLLVMLFVIIPLSGLGLISGNGDLLVAACFSLLGISGVFSVARTRGSRIVGLLALSAPIGLGWYHALVPGPHTSLLRAALGVIALSWLAALTLRHVLRGGTITMARLQGAVAVYLLLAMIFGEIYWGIALYNPGAFHFPEDISTSVAARSGVFYFSLTTLTTVGYGDIVPIGPFARSLATMEGLLGQLYPAVLIGRLVSLQITNAQQDATRAEPR